MKKNLIGFGLGLILIGVGLGTGTQRVEAAPAIENMTDNRNEYANSVIPKYGKLEITFGVGGMGASNVFLPFDPGAPIGVNGGRGISVEGEFSADNWQTIERQPGFYYQEFAQEIKRNKEWFYPGEGKWKIRWAPPKTGGWKYRVRVTDTSGSSVSNEVNWTVGDSNKKGFIKVSADPRYFEFSDGTYFAGLGYNMNFDQISWDNPTLANQDNFVAMGQNGVELVRMWLSQWAIGGSAWNPWYSMHHHNTYIPRTGLTPFANEGLKMKISATSNWFDSCMFLGYSKGAPAVKRQTNYRISVRHRTFGVTGPRNTAMGNYGLVAKVGGWFDNCQDGGTGTPVTSYAHTNDSWAVLEGTWNSGTNDYLPYLYVAMENATAGDSYIDEVSVKEVLGDGSLGVNIVSKPTMNHQEYFDQRQALAFDKVVELAEKNNVFLRPVIHEKDDDVWLMMQADGSFGAAAADNFYGNFRSMTASRWYMRAWWRYLQARWGYSTQIHSWELLNEGDPASARHFALADELGKFMHQFGANKHLVSTSFWHSFPKDQFWANANYPDVDFADIHQYIDANNPNFGDSAQVTYQASMAYGAKRPGGAGKPVLRGETGFTTTGSEPPSNLLESDTTGVWLHKFLWGGLNPGGLLEQYWYANQHIYKRNSQGTVVFDHRPEFKRVKEFISGESLNNGRYVDVAASVSNPGIVVWGQKDPVSGRAYMWINNIDHTWKKVVDRVAISPKSGTIKVGGFGPSRDLSVEWWNTYTGGVERRETVRSDVNGQVELSVTGLQTDTAAKILTTSGGVTGTPSLPGDANGDNKVDGIDYVIWLSHYNQNSSVGERDGDFDRSGRVDGVDYVVWLNNYGR